MDGPSDRLINLVGALALGVTDRVRSTIADDLAPGGEGSAALIVLGHAPGMSIDQLCRVLRLSHPGTVRLVDRLANAGLAVRSVAQHDRRVVALNLTELGKARRKALLDRRQEAVADVLQVVPPADRAVLERAVVTMLQAMPDGAVSAMSICRLCDNARCAACPMNAFD